ncbi:MAG: energy transducer TonB [Flavobacteriales bacterium]|nr:energy transducer TonB [Flavobacteriales bacterium]
MIIANLSFALLYLFYVGVFKRLTFFHWNRFYLMAALLFSTVVPLIRIPSWGAGTDALPVVELPLLVLSASQQPMFQPVIETAFWIYLVGVLVGLSVLFRAIYLIMQSAKDAREEQAEAGKYLVSEGSHAFSFFSRIQIGATIDGETKEMILTHEQVHKEEWHSIDVMLYAVTRVVAWFNPFVHLAAKEVQLNHEFLADERTMRTYGQDYQYSLLDQALDTQVFRLTNAFYSTSIIKNRILMMNKNRSRKWSLAVYALIIPVIAGTVWLSSCTQQPGIPDSEQKVAISDAITPKASDQVMNKDEVDVEPSFPGGQEGLLTYFKEGFVYPKELSEAGVEGKVMLSFVVNEDGSLSDIEAVKSDDPLLEAPGIEFVKGMPNWEPGTKDDVKVKVKMILPIQYSMK